MQVHVYFVHSYRLVRSYRCEVQMGGTYTMDLTDGVVKKCLKSFGRPYVKIALPSQTKARYHDQSCH